MLNAEYGGGGSQAATSKKRKSRLVSTANGEENLVESSGEDSDINMDETDGLWDIIDDWKERGRQRRQKSSDETVSDTKVHLAPDVEADLNEVLRKGMSEP